MQAMNNVVMSVWRSSLYHRARNDKGGPMTDADRAQYEFPNYECTLCQFATVDEDRMREHQEKDIHVHGDEVDVGTVTHADWIAGGRKIDDIRKPEVNQ